MRIFTIPKEKKKLSEEKMKNNDTLKTRKYNGEESETTGQNKVWDRTKRDRRQTVMMREDETRLC